MRSTLTATLLLVLASCSSPGDLSYAPTVAIAPGPTASIGTVAASDRRDEKPNRLATIRGGYGNPFKVLDTTRPVSEEVAAVFTTALQARGMLGAPGTAPYRLQLLLRTFYINKWMESTAKLEMDLQLVDNNGSVVFADTIADQDSTFKIFSGPIFGDVSEQLAQGQLLLNKAVDRVLDKPGFRAALAGRATSVGTTKTDRPGS